jgi:hypothetical protein
LIVASGTDEAEEAAGEARAMLIENHGYSEKIFTFKKKISTIDSWRDSRQEPRGPDDEGAPRRFLVTSRTRLMNAIVRKRWEEAKLLIGLVNDENMMARDQGSADPGMRQYVTEYGQLEWVANERRWHPHKSALEYAMETLRWEQADRAQATEIVALINAKKARIDPDLAALEARGWMALNLECKRRGLPDRGLTRDLARRLKEANVSRQLPVGENHAAQDAQSDHSDEESDDESYIEVLDVEDPH